MLIFIVTVEENDRHLKKETESLGAVPCIKIHTQRIFSIKDYWFQE